MLELPEAKVIAGQLTRTIVGKTIVKVEANVSSHKFAFFRAIQPHTVIWHPYLGENVYFCPTCQTVTK